MNEQAAGKEYPVEERTLVLNPVNFENIKKFSDVLGVKPADFLNDVLGFMEFECFVNRKIDSTESKKLL